MAKRRTSFVVDFNKLRSEKQSKSEQALMDVYDLFFTYIENNANLREKVRAKHLFKHKTQQPKEQAFDKLMNLHFEHWFAFDYVTVIGSRMFDLFIRDQKEAFTKPMLDLCGHLMLMTLEPVKIMKYDHTKIEVKRLMTGEIDYVYPFLFSPVVETGNVAFMRIAPVGFKQKVIGPVFTVYGKEENRVNTQIADAIRKTDDPNQQVRLKRFMKEYGIDYLRYAKM